ncbi:hypothetical protein [Aquariibacter albus]|uniref:O-antigen ligase domain-containing protein n=1 Tax=Aquariibacter albus TaxID=2759899 RepID=A0A839HST6_9BURK|nr:hypothetical protein [Aquariibacter albus]MBB1162580.1 hypothetical protein [Aquariibacter albus]
MHPTPLLALAVFLGAAVLLFWRLPVRHAALAVALGGWVMLPAGPFPAASTDGVFAYWILGQALPSDLPLGKSVIAPAVALLGLALRAPRLLGQLRPAVPDLPLLLWCLSPLLLAPFQGGEADPPPLRASLLLFGGWGLPWLLGRAVAGDAAGRALLLQALSLTGLACLPFALAEAWTGPWLHEALYGPHPFDAIGSVRYLGHRPMGFFEDGNQYGIVLALASLAAVWRARSLGMQQGRGLVAALLLAMSLAAQSVGALLLLGLGLALLASASWLPPRRLAPGLAGLLLLGGLVYASGLLPLRQWATGTTAGQAVVQLLRDAGRHSLTWRISKEQALLKPALARPLTGTGRWDWFRPEGVRPWGLTLLIVGQYGLPALACVLGLWLLPVLRAASRAPPGPAWQPGQGSWALAVMLLLALGDALLNSFIAWPALLAAGALADPGPD